MDIMSYLLGKKSSGGGGGGGSAEPNIFIQETEPTKKDGIWIESDSTYSNVVVDDNINNVNEWDERESTNFTSGGMQSYNSFIYKNELYVCQWSSNNVSLYKFNKNTNLFNKLNVTLINTGGGSGSNLSGIKGAVVDNYYISYENSNKWLIKINLDTLEATYTKLSVSAYGYGTTEYYNGNAYLFGCQVASGSNNYVACRKIDYNNDTFVDLPSLNMNYSRTYRSQQWSSIKVGTKVYLFNFSNTTSEGRWVIFDLEREVFSDYYDLPSELKGINLYVSASLSNEGNNIYLIYNGVWKLDISNRQWTKITSNLPQQATKIVQSLTPIYNGDLLLISGTRTINNSDISSNKINFFKLTNKTYNNGDLIIKQNASGYAVNLTELVNINSTGKVLVPISNVFLYNNDQLYYDLPTYIGDGTSWVKIKG